MMFKWRLISIITGVLCSLALMHIEAAELSAEHRMPEPIALQFISRMAAGYERGQTENEQTELFRDLATSNDTNNLCSRIALDLQNNPRSAVIDNSARYAGTLPLRLSEIVTYGFPERGVSNGYWLTPFMIAVLRGNRELLDCIISNRTHRSIHLNAELMLANQQALNGYTYPLARLLQRQPDLVEHFSSLGKLFNTRPTDNDEFIVRYWLEGSANEPQQLHAHPLLMQFQLSERSVESMLHRLIYSTGERLNIAWNYPAALPLIPRVLQEIRSRLSSQGPLTLDGIASVVFTPDFKQWLMTSLINIAEQQSSMGLEPEVADRRPIHIYQLSYAAPHGDFIIPYSRRRSSRRQGMPQELPEAVLYGRTRAAGYITRQLTAAFAPDSEEYTTIDQLRENILSRLYQNEAQMIDSAIINQAINHEIARVRETVTARTRSTSISIPQSEGPLAATQLVDATGTGRFYAQSTVQDLQRRGMRDPETRELLAPVAVTDLTSYLKKTLCQRRAASLIRQRAARYQDRIPHLIRAFWRRLTYQEISEAEQIAHQRIAIEDIPTIDAVTHEAIILAADQARTLITEIVSHDPRLANLDEQTRAAIIEQLLAQSAVGTEHNLHDLEKLQTDVYPAMVQSISSTEQEEAHA